MLGLVSSTSFLQAASSALSDVGSSTCAEGTFAGVEANGVALCVHADAPPLHPALALPTALPGIPCYAGTGARAHVYYAYPAGRANKLPAQRAELRDLIAKTDAIYALSARGTGGTRHVRWLMTSSCQLVITPIAVTGTSDMTAAFRAVLNSHTLGRYDHAVILLDWSLGYGVCGYGSLRSDPQPGSANINNHYQGTAEIANGSCRNPTSVAHELGHTLGAVPPTAPHHSYNFHCYDGLADVMCYDDGTLPAPLTAGKCPPDQLATMDCGHDDYFNTNPAAGSFLATHWNVARSALLASVNPPRWDPVPNPTVRITNVASGSTFVGTGGFADQTPTTVSVAAAGGRITSVSYYVDDVQFLPAATVAPWSGTPVRAMLQDAGWHNLYAVLHLSDGRSRTSPIVRVHQIDGPVLSSPDGSRTVSGAVPFSVAAAAAVTAQVARVDYSVDAQVVATSTSAPFTASYNVSALSEGSHFFEATLVRADGTTIGTTASRLVTVANDGSSLSLRTAAAAGSAVSGAMAVSVDVAGIPAGRSITSVTFNSSSGETLADTAAPYSWAWPTCGQASGCAGGNELTMRAEVLFDDDTTVELERSFVSAATHVSARVRLTAGARLRAGTAVAIPFSVTALGGSTLQYVQVFTNKGYLGGFNVTAAQRTVSVRAPSSWRGGDAVWVRVVTTSYGGSTFTAHVPVTWTA
ncbi:MAG: hypothetical protein QOC60_1457 [Frankiaceae bacterium]|nr:hypothetical protein [Frankiaceae bacterium]